MKNLEEMLDEWFKKHELLCDEDYKFIKKMMSKGVVDEMSVM